MQLKYNEFDLASYLKDLSIVGSLSGLFSESNIPFLHYRVAENLYCNSMKAKNMSRMDVSIDAQRGSTGIAIKTFIDKNHKNIEKIAEFNRQQSNYKSMKVRDKIHEICSLRNRRIEFAKNAYGLNKIIYHCVVRNTKGFFLFEEPLHPVDLESIVITTNKKHIIDFTDGISIYKFNESKSVLYKQFDTHNSNPSVEINILDNPIELLRNIDILKQNFRVKIPIHLVLPLFTIKYNKPFIYTKSGLNQWNAGGRKRHHDEIYIPFPSYIKEKFDDFFPNRNESFTVILPNEEKISMKVCQDNGKALMSNPNNALGKWLLRDVLKIPQNKLITYEMIEEVGIDSICFEKINDEYRLNFRKIGSFNDFAHNDLLEDIED